VRILNDGKVLILVSATDMGTWAKTTLSQIAAEELGVSLDNVRIISMDTEIAPIDMGSWGSRVMFLCGNAVKRASADAKRQLFESVAEKLEANIQDLEVRENKISIKGSPTLGLSLAEAVEISAQKVGQSIIGKGHYHSPTEFIDRKTGRGNISGAYTFATQIAEVEVDPETGQVQVLKVAAAHDVGRAINPLAVEGQIEGSVAMGVGFALMEEFHYKDGQVLNPSFLDFRIPTSKDVPEVQSIIVETDDPEGPFGAKGIGEPALVPTAPAIANAIYDAVGVRIKDLPMTQEKVLRALKEKGKEKT
jgi:CO/xanthine dehydrogenase Mo-binding subunit